MGNCVTMEMHGNSNSDFSHSSKMCARTGVVEINLGHFNYKTTRENLKILHTIWNEKFKEVINI